MNRIDKVLSSEGESGGPVTVWQFVLEEGADSALLQSQIEKRQKDGIKGAEIWELSGTEQMAEAETLLAQVKELRQAGYSEVPVALRLPFHQVFRYGLEAFTDACMEAGVDGLRILDLPMEEQPQLKVYLLKEGAPYLLQEICPQSGDRIPDVTGYAKGYVYCTADPAFWEEQTEYGNMLSFFLYAAEAVCPVPLVLDFKNTDEAGIREYLEIAGGRTVRV